MEELKQSELDFDNVNRINPLRRKLAKCKLNGTVQFGGPVFNAHKLTDMGLIGKDDVYRWFQEKWTDPATGKLVKQNVFFKFVREMIEVERSSQKLPRLRTEALRDSMAGVFMVHSRKPKNSLNKHVSNNAPPRPNFEGEQKHRPHIRLTGAGIQRLIDAWPKFIMEYNEELYGLQVNTI